jgi:hypothetical protein
MNPIDCYNIPNPVFDLLIHLNEKDADGLERNAKLQMLIKNCRTNFYKFFEAVNQISEIQKDPELLKRLPILKMQSVEYCFLKISTTWDIAYQIAEELLGKSKKKDKNDDKYDVLEKEFEAYASHLPRLKLDWYREINKIRNRVVHGGINVIVFHENDLISFQAYDGDVEEQVKVSALFCERDRPLVHAEKYFSFYTVLLYNYLADFFRYILIRLTGDTNPVIKLPEDPFGVYSLFKHWQVNGLERLNNVCDAIRDNWAGEEVPFENIQGETYFA